MNVIASVGWLRTKGTNSRRSMVNISQLVFAVASALLTWPERRAISPKISPGPIRLRIALRPSGDEMLIFTVPLITANRLVGGSPFENIAVPFFRVECLAYRQS